MPGKDFTSVSLRDELIQHVKQLRQKIGTYSSNAEFISEAIRLRIESIEKNIDLSLKAEKEAKHHDEASNGRQNK